MHLLFILQSFLFACIVVPTYLIFIDDIKKAQKKLKKCDVSSDIQSSELSDYDIENKK